MSPTTSTTRLARPAWRLGFLAAVIAAMLAVSVMPAMATPAQGCKGNANGQGNDPCDRNSDDDDDDDDDGGSDDCKGNANGHGNDPCDRDDDGDDDDGDDDGDDDDDCKGNPNGHGNDPCDRDDDDDDDDDDCKGNPNGHGNDPCENPDPDGPGGPITPPAPLPSACPAGIVPASAFTDIDGNVHEFSIDCVSWWEIALGTSSTTYSPARRVTRAQTATFLANLIDATGGNLPAAGGQGFKDIRSSVHRANINRLAAAGIVVGVSARRFEPNDRVSRAQMVSMIVGAYNLVADANLGRGRDAFDDDDNSVHEGNINKAAAAGLALGTAERTFSPGGKTRRDQMATFLARLLDNLVEQGHGTPPAA